VVDDTIIDEGENSVQEDNINKKQTTIIEPFFEIFPKEIL
jgi:hypothetical protein